MGTPEDGYLLNDFSLVTGAPTFTVTVTDYQINGEYKLAQNVGDYLGTISVGNGSTVFGSKMIFDQTISYNDTSYTFKVVNNNLHLVVSATSSGPVVSGSLVNIYSGGQLVSSGEAITGASVGPGYYRKMGHLFTFQPPMPEGKKINPVFAGRPVRGAWKRVLLSILITLIVAGVCGGIWYMRGVERSKAAKAAAEVKNQTQKEADKNKPCPAKAPVKAAAKAPVKAAVKAPVKAAVKAPVKAAAKAPVPQGTPKSK